MDLEGAFLDLEGALLDSLPKVGGLGPLAPQFLRPRAFGTGAFGAIAVSAGDAGTCFPFSVISKSFPSFMLPAIRK